MASSYSQDLRDRVIDAVIEEGMSRRAAAQRFGVSDSAAIKWLERFEESGLRTPVGTGGHRPSAQSGRLGPSLPRRRRRSPFRLRQLSLPRLSR